MYVFKRHSSAERYKDRAFQDEVIDRLVYEFRSSRTFPHRSLVRTTYNKNPPGSPIRRLLVNMTLVYGWVGWFNAPATEHSDTYLQDVVIAFMQSDRDNNSDNIKAELEAGVPSSYHHLHTYKSEANNENNNERLTGHTTVNEPPMTKNYKA